MKPGQSVESPRSITVAPSGIDSPSPTARIFLPSTITMPPWIKTSDLPSNSRAALSTMGFGFVAVAGSCEPVWRSKSKGMRLAGVIGGLLRGSSYVVPPVQRGHNAADQPAVLIMYSNS